LEHEPSVGGSERGPTVEMVATTNSLRSFETPPTFEAARAEALFASTLQSCTTASPEQVRHAVTTTLRRLGVRGCAAQMAGEFGDHPDTAAARMTWALATINTVYPATSMAPPPQLRSVAVAS
jgi:hypothetical protein